MQHNIEIKIEKIETYLDILEEFKVDCKKRFLAHDYEKVDYVEICENSLNKLDDIKTYLKYIKKVV